MLYPHFKRLGLDVPFLSGQILSKFAKSSDGRSLSIGTQYLKSKPCEVAIPGTEMNKPYRVQSLRQLPLLRHTTDKILHNLQLRFIPPKSLGDVENITIELCEGNFVLDVGQATLQVGSSRSALADKDSDKPA